MSDVCLQELLFQDKIEPLLGHEEVLKAAGFHLESPTPVNGEYGSLFSLSLILFLQYFRSRLRLLLNLLIAVSYLVRLGSSIFLFPMIFFTIGY